MSSRITEIEKLNKRFLEHTKNLRMAMTAFKDEELARLFTDTYVPVSAPMWTDTAHEEAFYEAVAWYLEHR